MKTRNQIENKFKWDLSSIIKDDQEIESIFRLMEQYLDAIPIYKGKLGNKDMLYSMLTNHQDDEQRIYDLGYFLFNSLSVDSSDTRILKYIQRYEILSSKISVASAYIQPELYELSDEYLLSVLKDPRFTDYDNYINDIIKLKPHKLSEHDTTLLSKMGKFIDNNSNIHSLLTDSEMEFENAIDGKGKAHPVNSATYSNLLHSKDRILKKNAFNSMMSGFKSLNKTFASIYLNDIENDKFHAELKRYPDVLTEELFTNDIPRSVFDNIIKHTNNNIPTMNRFIKALKQYTGIKDFSYYDLFQKIDIGGKISLERAHNMILTALAPLGNEYLDLVKAKLNDQSIDYLPNKNKNSGAYCSNCYGQKTVILMNYLYDFNSVDTLIHEMGHCINAEYFNSSQPRTKAEITIFAAEIASTVNEILLLDHCIKNAKEKEKIAYLYQLLDTVRSTIFRQVLFSEFELYAHQSIEQDKPITYEDLNKYYYDLNKKYYGKALKVPTLLQYEWERIPHFYNAYYVYSYATGLVTAICIAKKILTDQDFSNQYIRFLKNGTAKPAVEMLKEIGIDMTSDQPYRIAFDFIKEYVITFEKSVKN